MNKRQLQDFGNRLERTGLWILGNLKPLALFNLLVSRKNYRKQLGIQYGSRPRQKLDVYAPVGETRALPVVVFFYGGSWQSGCRQDYRFVAQALNAQGVVVVIPDYRIYPEVRFPGFIEDGAAAFAWVRNNISSFGGSSAGLFVMGHSAGAYIAAMLSLDSRYLGQVGLSPGEMRGFIGLSGPYDFLPLKQPRLIEIFGGADGIPETQPVNFVTASAPPALLLHGATDRIVRAGNTRRLAQRWREVGRPVLEIIYPSYKHLSILLYMASFLQDGEPVMRDVAGFIRGHK